MLLMLGLAPPRLVCGGTVQMIGGSGDTLDFSGIRDVVRALFVADDATAAMVTV